MANSATTTSFQVTGPTNGDPVFPAAVPFPADVFVQAMNALDSDSILQDTVALTSAQILALNATPVQLIPAPGAAKIAVLDSIVVEMTRTATAYANGGVLEIRYTNASGALVSATFPASLVTGGAGVAYAINIGLATILTPVVNAAIVIDNATAPFITGTGTARIFVKWHIVNVA
jgi:hypothetical protein